MVKNLEILSDVTALQQRVIEIATEQILAALTTRGACNLVLAGGNTPKPVYEALAQQKLPWQKIQIFWGDERYVDPEDSKSNQKMARLAWLDQVEFPKENIHPMLTGSQDPWQDAENYERQLKKSLPVSPEGFPEFDLIFLGMGDDGHTASLFPYTDALKVQDRWVTVGEKDGEPRITLTFPVINAARCVVVMITGANKRAALEQVLSPTGDSSAYPARLIQPQGESWWLVDQAAASELI